MAVLANKFGLINDLFKVEIIIIPCVVAITLYSWWSPARNWLPGADSSSRISTLKAVPSRPVNTANIRYSVPMSLAFVEKSQRVRIDLYWGFLVI